MEEIKESKIKKIIKFLVDHIMVISAIIFLCVLFFSSCSTAKAAEYNESYTNWLIDKLDNAPNYSAFTETSGVSAVLNDIQNNASAMFRGECLPAYNNTAYVVGVEINGGFGWLLDAFQNSSGYSGLSYEIGFNASNKRLQGRRMISTSNSPFAYVFAFDNVTGDILYCSKYVNNYQATSSFTLTSYDLNTSLNSSTGTKTIYWIPSEGRVNISYVYNNSTSGNYAYRIPDYNFEVSDSNMVFAPNENLNWTGYFTNEFTVGPEYIEDSRLRMYITNAIGGPRLNVNVVDFAQSFPYPDQTILQPKEINLTIETDGVESLFILDPSTAIWASKYWATVPVSDIAELDGHDVVKITKVQFTLYDAFANMTEDFFISTDFALKDTTEEIDPSTILPPGDIYEDAKSTAQIDLLIQTLEANGSGSVYGDFTYQSSIPVLPAWSDEIYTDLTRMEDNSSAFGGHWYDHYPWSFGDLQINPVEYINEFCEGYASVYDVIIFRVYGWVLDASFSTDNPTIGSYSTGVKGYIVLYTNKFYNHSTSLTTLDILTAIQSDFNQQKSNWNWLVSRLNDFESKSLEAMNAELRVERESRDWLKSIWNQIDNLEMPIYDDSNLLDKLDYIISILDDIAGFFSGDSNEGYSKFTKWIEEIEDDGEITPHEWANNIFDYVTGLYHSLSDGTSYYTDDISDYIDYVNQNGNSDPGNYFFAMYEGTYDPHNYYGWTGGIS